MKFLRFENQSVARAALAAWMFDGDWPAYIGDAAVDVVGVIRKPVSEPDEHGAQEFEPLPGFHINLSRPVPELAEFEIEAPATPARVFAGYEPNPAPRFLQFASLQFLELFTEAEQLAVVEATLVSAPVKLWYDKLLAADFVTRADPRTEQGLDTLVTAGLLTEQRRDEILDAMQTTEPA